MCSHKDVDSCQELLSTVSLTISACEDPSFQSRCHHLSQHRCALQSPRVADVLRAGGRGAAAGDSDEEALLGSAEFQRMAREVELLGAAHLDKHEKKKWEARALQQMGAKVGHTEGDHVLSQQWTLCFFRMEFQSDVTNGCLLNALFSRAKERLEMQDAFARGQLQSSYDYVTHLSLKRRLLGSLIVGKSHRPAFLCHRFGRTGCNVDIYSRKALTLLFVTAYISSDHLEYAYAARFDDPNLLCSPTRGLLFSHLQR